MLLDVFRRTKENIHYQEHVLAVVRKTTAKYMKKNTKFLWQSRRSVWQSIGKLETFDIWIAKYLAGDLRFKRTGSM